MDWTFLHRLQNVYDFDFTSEDDKAILINRVNGRSIEVRVEKLVDLEGNTEIRYIVAFVTQHRHIDDLKGVEEYIISILEEEVLAIEFYTNGKNRFGGDIARSDGAAISIDYLAKHFHYPAEYLSQFDYEVYSWSGKYDDTRQKCQ